MTDGRGGMSAWRWTGVPGLCHFAAMQAILDVVLPVFAIILAGYLCGRGGILGAAASEALNGFVYFAALPALFFVATARVPLGEILNLPFLAAYMAGMIAVALAVFLIGRRFFPGNGAELGLQNMSAIFSNTGYMGIPLLITAFGDSGKLPAIIATLINGAVVMGFYIAVVEFAQSRAERLGHVLADVAKGVAKSPLVLSALAGILWSACGFGMPTFLGRFCDILGAAAPPAALFAMGLFMVGKSFRGDRAEIAALTAVKLLLHPAITFALIWLVPLDADWSRALITLAALPTGSLTFVLSSRYGVYTQRSTGVIMASTLASVVTLSLLFNWMGIR